LVSVPLVHHCCEHQPDASQLNEQRAPLATAPFWRAQAPGGSLMLLAEAVERVIAATAPANKAILTIDVARILSPLSQNPSPRHARHAAIFYIAMPRTLATSLGRIRFVQQNVGKPMVIGLTETSSWADVSWTYLSSRQMPSASCAGRSEIENSTDSFSARCE
jgi:hypothetical protein